MGTTEHNKPYQRQAQETCLLIFVAGERMWPACWECQPDCPARCSPHLTQRIYLLLPPPLPPPSPPSTVPHFHSKLDQRCQEDAESPCCQKWRFHIIQMCPCVMLDVASIRKSCSLRSYSQDFCLWLSLFQLFTTQTPVLPATLHAWAGLLKACKKFKDWSLNFLFLLWVSFHGLGSTTSLLYTLKY